MRGAGEETPISVTEGARSVPTVGGLQASTAVDTMSSDRTWIPLLFVPSLVSLAIFTGLWYLYYGTLYLPPQLGIEIFVWPFLFYAIWRTSILATLLLMTW